MNSRERVLAALRRLEPDRVPVLEILIDEGVARAAVPGCRDVAGCMDQLGMDGVGCGAAFHNVAVLPDRQYTDEWGVTYRVNRKTVAHPIRGPIRTLADARAYRPPDPDAPHRLGLLPELVRRYQRRRAILFHHRAAFMWAAYLMGLDKLLMNFLVAPEVVEIVMGNIDSAHLLPYGSTEDVRQAVRRAIADAGRDGGFILSSSNSVHSSCKPENLVAMVQACKQWGVYPLERPAG
jgi:uroporphyrinogen-III decarboxylase